MKAIEGRTYAQVIRGRCHWIFTKDELPEWADGAFVAVDVTARVPNVGDLYDDKVGTFSPPPPPVLTPEEQARIARRAALEAEAADALIDKLRSATPDEIRDYISDNVVDLPTARAALVRLAIGLAFALNGGSAK